jgi:hypothetical protein
LEYFGYNRGGKIAGPLGSAGAAGAACLASFGAAAGVAAAVAFFPYSALRKSLHFILFSVPAFCAALYFALHLRMVSPRAGAAIANAVNPAPAITPASIGQHDRATKSKQLIMNPWPIYATETGRRCLTWIKLRHRNNARVDAAPTSVIPVR